MIASRAASVFGCQRDALKELMNWFLRFLQEVIELGTRFLYQSIAVFPKVMGNNQHLIGPPMLW